VAEIAPSNETDVERAASLHAALLGWYANARRDLPWRRNPNPYSVLVSEIMLQQTQIDRVVPYYHSFMTRFPSLESLAEGPRSEVIRLWGGLGYDRRAVNLCDLACAVAERFDGCLPSDKAALLSLPGIGPYTAGALLSIAFGRDEPALDTNVRRVLGRHEFGQPPSEAELRAAAVAMLPAGRAAEWNQALMDLGATICLSRHPRCLICPIRGDCRSPGERSIRAATRPRQAPFHSSRRYYRGRLLDELRRLPAGEQQPLSSISASLMSRGVAEPSVGWQILGQELARDGLATIQEGPDEIRLGLG
jgi:A/G-specific adenine glycosylase